MDSEELAVRWSASWRDLFRGLPADVAPHLVATGVATAWIVADGYGGSPALRWLGVVVSVTQLLALLHLVALRFPARPSAQRSLVLRGTTFVVRDGQARQQLDAPVAGVLDADGVVRVHFTDGRTIEVPWRAFTNAELRQLRRHLRVRTGDLARPAHVPVRRVGRVLGPGAWPHPLLAVAGASALAALPWLLSAVGS